MFGSGLLTRGRWALVAVLLVGTMAGCTTAATTTSTAAGPTTTIPTAAIPTPMETTSTTSGVDLPQLRIVNTGPEDLIALAVIFPESGRIGFGDVAAGETSEYRGIPGGVYRYAAYEYEADGRLARQPVIDWVGELPVPGSRFTYRVAVGSSAGPGVQVLAVVVDAP